MLKLRQAITISWSLVLIIFFLPLWLLEPGERPGETAPAPTLPIDRVIQTTSPRDKGRAVRLLQPGSRAGATSRASPSMYVNDSSRPGCHSWNE